ncbi:MAG: antitoxin family protein [Archaeoglobales archaeon]|nr:antitoxin family protein [Archaeoglobales archaeon]
MPKIIEAIYENGVFKPLEKVNLKNGERVKIRLEDADSIVEDVFGILKGKDTNKALEELENEWGFC